MKKSLRPYLLLIFLSFNFLIFNSDLSAQCAMCKQAAETSLKSNPNSIARGLNSGILYLMAVPYLLIAFIFRKQIKHLFKRLFKKRIKSSAN
jgi:hypothetical protein